MNIPRHIAIIMDGNGRWASLQGKKRIYGHYVGAQNIDDIVVKAKEYGVKFLTLYAFSTENWKRPNSEVNFLMSLFAIQMKKKSIMMQKENIKFKCIGDIEGLGQKQKEGIIDLENKTSDNNSITMNFAINYGSKAEILLAVKGMCNDVVAKKISINDINFDTFGNYLYTKGIPDVDLLIRTGGEKRISNFLLWQSAYAEFIFLKQYWPEFTGDDLVDCIKEFSERKRRFGGLDD